MRRELTASFAVVLAACGSDELLRLGPAPRPTATVDAGVPDVANDVTSPPEDSAADTGPVIRTVSTRNPFGNVEADNMLWDGDFEWHSSFAPQYGWATLGFALDPSFGQVRTSTECESGLKCGYLTQSQRIAAIGVSPTGRDVAASVWIRVPTDLCYDVTVRLFACDFAGDPDVSLAPDTDVPGPGGWCRFATVTPPRERATCLYVEAQFVEGEALVDDAVVTGVPAGAKVQHRVGPPLTALDRKRLEEARVELRAVLAPAIRPATQAAREYASWRRSKMQ